MVRRLAGYGRLSGLNAAATLGRLYQSARLYVNFFQPSSNWPASSVTACSCADAIIRRAPPVSACSPRPWLRRTSKSNCRQQFAALDPVALLKTIRDTQQELAVVSDGTGQPPARATDDLSAFLDGLTSAWQNVDRPPQGRGKAATKHWWRTRIDPFAYTWPMVEEWLRAEPEVSARTLMHRLCGQFPDVYPTGAQLRTLQRPVQLWRNEQVKRLIFESTGAQAAGSEAGISCKSCG